MMQVASRRATAIRKFHKEKAVLENMMKILKNGGHPPAICIPGDTTGTFSYGTALSVKIMGGDTLSETAFDTYA
ncbi:hypothetical protein [Ethanoligenens harbinense]|nr:hypothetical protein [Ethanoligenens harbinense]AVQ96324.1 hypothetical protein CXQ68_08885 [Ethanoligenens harbinense YUAN-3]AYF38982.1 hypothetical protein CXP51_08755 [Ethanoligenens harbinense]AYF41735.1 hypothetical protein CN246_08905 [Ethanoligenens harbinense]QCN92565.1 hypothetical protein DRA42_08915 [Ethanoligenens harbinense]